MPQFRKTLLAIEQWIRKIPAVRYANLRHFVINLFVPELAARFCFMSDTATTAAPEDQTELFSAVEIEQFGADDVTAGGAIGKMLSALFLYTVLAMGIAGWWTYSSIAADKASAETEQSDHTHGASPAYDANSH